MDSADTALVKTITIRDIELRTQTQHNRSGVRQFYIQFATGDTSRSTISETETKNHTSWNEPLFFHVNDRPVLRINVYQKHHLNSDEKVGGHIINGVLEKLRDGVLEYTLRGNNSDLSDPSSLTLKFAVAVRPRASGDADVLQIAEPIARATEEVNISGSNPVALDHSNSAVSTGKNVVDKIRTVNLEHPLGDLLDRILHLDKMVTGIAQVHLHVSLACSVISFAYQVLTNRKGWDERTIRLAGTMCDAFTFVHDAEPVKAIKAHVRTITLLIQQVTECGYFIIEYVKQGNFWIRTGKYGIADIDSKIADYENKLRELRAALLDGVAMQTEITVVRMMNVVEVRNAVDEIVESIDLNEMVYAVGARFAPEKACLPGTRESFLRQICDVLNNPAEDAPRVCLLTGVAGSGKSAVAHSIAQLYDKQRRLGSSYCFAGSDVASRYPKNLFATIARDLADHDPPYKNALWRVVKNDRALRTSLSFDLVEKFIIEPSKHLHTVGPLIIVIDALDESGNRASRRQLLRTIAEKISENAFPANLRFLITTRPENDILTKLKPGLHIVHKNMGNIPTDVVDGDIEKFISCSLQNHADILSSGSHRDWCQLLVHHSQHLFLWASIACRFIKGYDSPWLYPCERLDILLQADVHSLDILYQNILNPLFTSENSRERFRSVMTTVLALNEPLSLTSLSALLGGDLNVRPIIKHMGSLLDGVLDEQQPIRPLHTSFCNFLLDKTRSGDFHVIVQHQDSIRLGQASLECIRDMILSAIGGLEDSETRNAVPDQSARAKQSMPPHAAYSCRYWLHHLRLAGPLLEMLNDITRLLSSLDTTSVQQPSCDSSRDSETMPAIIADLVNNAFSYIVSIGDFRVAVEFLEQARGIMWNQLACFDVSVAALESRGSKGRELASRFARSSADLKGYAGNSGGEAANSYLRIKEEWQYVVDEIRQMDGFSRFLLPLQFEYLQQAAERGPVIILNASKYTCDALIVLNTDPPVHVPLPNCSPDDSVELCSVFSHLIRHNQENPRLFQQFLRELWTIVVEPIVNILRGTIQLPLGSRIWWCPTSKFSTLPLHAAGPYRTGEKKLVDLYISSYAPSLSALVRARERIQALKTARDTGHPKITFAAVGQSKPVNASELPGVEEEVFKIQNKTNVPADVKFETVTGDAATIEGAIQAFHEHSWIHLACHSAQDPKNPFDSGFAMRDGRLTLMRIIQEQYTHSELAFLSASNTAIGNASIPDEVLHLAAGMQFTGFNGVIGTLGPIDDAVAHEVVTRFYVEMFKQPVINSEYAAKALNVATRMAEAQGVPLDQRALFMHIGI